MTIVALSPVFNGQQFFDNTGKPLAGGKIFSYEAGSTSILQTTYVSAAGTTTNQNPITLNSSGRPPNDIWLDVFKTYNMVLTAADGTTIIEAINTVVGSTASQNYTGLAPFSITAAQTSGEMLVTAELHNQIYRSPTLSDGTVIRVFNPMSIVSIPALASLGTVSGSTARIGIVEFYNNGNSVLGVFNQGHNLIPFTETELESPTVIGDTATTDTLMYSQVAVVANTTYRYLGYFDAIWSSSTGWASPTLVQYVQNALSGNATTLFRDGTNTIIGNILPDATNTRNFGSAAFKFNTIYATTFNGQATTALYADLAENYVSDENYAAGTVVCFGGDAEVTICVEDGCRKVAGVVSTDPAYLMNAGLVGVSVAVALQGRVPVAVVGKVAKGDMMVAAGNGKARAEADPKLGQVIGKALEDFDGAEGVIEVVIGKY